VLGIWVSYYTAIRIFYNTNSGVSREYILTYIHITGGNGISGCYGGKTATQRRGVRCVAGVGGAATVLLKDVINFPNSGDTPQVLLTAA
jgi:hypothetical protein